MRARLHRTPASGPALGIISLLLLSASPHAGAAQAGPLVPVGSTVRAEPTGAGARWVQGRLVAATNGSVTIRVHKHGETVTLPTRTLARFEVSQGRRAHTVTGTLIGLGLGAGAGLLLGLALKTGECIDFCEIEVTTGDVLALTAVAAGLGAGVGH